MLDVDIIEQDIADLDMDLFKTLLSDKSTGSYILWGTDAYAHLGESYAPEKEMRPDLVIGQRTRVIQPRVSKSLEEQQERTRKKAEVFTPSWICNKMNNYCDADWFGRENVFNVEDGHRWITTAGPIEFPGRKTWKDYVDSRRLEITCGEAPYIASRYDAATGELIPVQDRIGILDRKLRVVRENCSTEEEWLKWAIRAFESTYGFEFQGDNLLIARVNLVATFIDNMNDCFGKSPSVKQLRQVANIVAWNIWQMDGINACVPFTNKQSSSAVDPDQYSIWDLFPEELEECAEGEAKQIDCEIYDWRARKRIVFKSVGRGR